MSDPSSASASVSAPTPMLIGWSHIDITPEGPVQIHGQLAERVSTHVNDPLTATAMAIENRPAEGQPEQAILISCDLTNFTQPYLETLRTRVANRLPDFDSQYLSVSSTHTHTSPVFIEGVYPEPKEGVMHPRDYAALLLDRFETLAVAAWNRRKRAAISHAMGQAAIGFNRRVVYKDGSAKMYGSTNTPDFKEIEGASDPQIELLFTYDDQQRLMGLVAALPCPAQVVENKSFLSADLWGVARQLLREHFGPQLQVLGLTGAAGDQSPRDLVRRGRGEPSMRDLEGMHEMGRRLANAVIDAHENAQSQPQSELVFRHRHVKLSLPMRKATQAEAEESRKALDAILAEKPEALKHADRDGRWARRYSDAIDRFNTQGEDPRYEADLHFMRLGDVALAFNPFELFLDYSHQIKARTEAVQTFVVQLTNDRAIYLPTEKAVRGGSYSAMIYDNIVGPEGGAQLVEETVAALNDLWP